jgi:hypothetical protein
MSRWLKPWVLANMNKSPAQDPKTPTLGVYP